MNPNWQDRYPEKMVTASEAVKKIRPGDRVYLASGCGEPSVLLAAVLTGSGCLTDIELLHLLSLGAAPYANESYAATIRANALLLGNGVSRAVREARADFTPIQLSQVPGLMHDRRMGVDVALITISPPDAHGYSSLGVSVDITKAAAESARLVIAQVNAHMPWTLGDAFLHVSQIHYLVDADEPLLQWKPGQNLDETVQAIAGHIAHLIGDGATLQMGIGPISETVLAALADKHDLGIHSYFITDGVMKLAQAGVMTGKRKSLHKGKIVGSAVIGTDALFNFVDRNHQVEMHPADYTGDPAVISGHQNMISISEAHEVDLTGLAAFDPLAEGGGCDALGAEEFIRGAARAEGGKVIIALPSTLITDEGIRSRIVPGLTPGVSILAGRTDAQYVVTEYGTAYLNGKSIRERAMSLVRIAHPDFRSELLHAAKRRRYVYPNQIMPPLFRPYPKNCEATLKLKDGSDIFIRPIRPDDEPLMKEMFYSFSEQTVYLRYHGILKSMPHNRLQVFCNIDYETEMTLVATIGTAGSEEVVAVGCYMADPARHGAELAFAVRDDWQRKGLGTALFTRLVDIARAAGVRHFQADVLIANSGMLKIFHRCGLNIKTTMNNGVVHVDMTLPIECAMTASAPQSTPVPALNPA